MTAVKDKLITAEELKVAYDDLHVSPLIVSIPSGQWSGSGNDYYFTVSASNVTSNSILVPNYDKTSASYLNGPVWCVPASGSFTVHTTAIPSGTVNILIQFVGIMGEAEYQVLADVYSKSQTYSKSEAVAKADIVNNLTSTATNQPLSAAQGKALNEKFGGVQIVPVTINGIILPDGTSSQTNTILDLSSFVPSGKSIHAISNIKFGLYPFPYVSNGNVLTYVADLSYDNKLTVVNKTTAWNSYTMHCVLFCV